MTLQYFHKLLLIASILIWWKEMTKLSVKMGEISVQNGNKLLQIPTFCGQAYFGQEIFKVT